MAVGAIVLGLTGSILGAVMVAATLASTNSWPTAGIRAGPWLLLMLAEPDDLMTLMAWFLWACLCRAYKTQMK